MSNIGTNSTATCISGSVLAVIRESCTYLSKKIAYRTGIHRVREGFDRDVSYH